MVNYNGNLVAKTNTDLQENRAFLYGDAVFETLKTLDNKVLFLEDHYFRLMASMRILRMEIPMYFTMEFLEEQIQKTLAAQSLKSSSFRVRVTCFRTGAGKYLPESKDVEYLISVEPLTASLYLFEDNKKYEVELYKDFYASKHLLSTLKTTNRLINITASIFAEENDYDNLLLINEDKNIVEAIQGNIYLIFGNQVVTPPVSDGCVNGIMRKKIKSLIERTDDFQWIERSISPFELQKADEMWISNVIVGIQPVTQYRKKYFRTQEAQKVIMRLNASIRFD